MSQMINGVMTYSNGKPLTSMMDNVLASRLGSVAIKAMKGSAGDLIDRGLILRRILEEEGFEIIEIAAKEKEQ